MDYIWAFERDTDRLEIRRADHAGQLLITGAMMSRRVLAFDSIAELVDFQMRFEEHLVRTGWRFVRFSPERRSGRDRRTGPTRTAHERRKLLRFPTPVTPEKAS